MMIRALALGLALLAAPPPASSSETAISTNTLWHACSGESPGLDEEAAVQVCLAYIKGVLMGHSVTQKMLSNLLIQADRDPAQVTCVDLEAYGTEDLARAFMERGRLRGGDWAAQYPDAIGALIALLLEQQHCVGEGLYVRPHPD